MRSHFVFQMLMSALRCLHPVVISVPTALGHSSAAVDWVFSLMLVVQHVQVSKMYCENRFITI